jgi:hypothetical protein
MVPVLSQVNAVHTLTSKNFNINLHLYPGLESGISPSGFPNNPLYTFHSSHANNRSDPSHFPWHHHPNDIWWVVTIIMLLILQFSSFSNINLYIHIKYMTISTMLHWLSWILGGRRRGTESHYTLDLIHRLALSYIITSKKAISHTFPQQKRGHIQQIE